MTRKNIILYILVAVGVAVIAVALYIYVYRSAKNGAGSLADPESLARVDTPGPATPTSAPPTTLANGQKSYVNAYYHFSLEYPPNLAVQEYAEAGGGRTIVFQENPATTTALAAPLTPTQLQNLNGFQIFIIPYAESQVSDARFKMDEPSGVRLDPQNVVIDGVTGEIFYGNNPTMGDTRELWMIHSGFLYEISTYKPLDQWLAGIMKTWQFN